MDKTPHYIIVSLFDDSALSAEEVAREIIGNLEDVRSAHTAYDDGFGHYVKVGDVIEA